MLVDFGWLIGSYLFGIMLGCLTGLIPGFHVNNVALIALSLSPVAVAVGIPLDAIAGIIVGILGYLVVIVVYLRALGRTGQTWGCRIVGIKVIRAETGEPLGVWTALGRQLFANIISAYILYLGYLRAAGDKQGETWHDKIVKSAVIKA